MTEKVVDVQGLATNDVKFKELKNYNDSCSVVFMGVLIKKDDENECKRLNDFLQNTVGFSKGKNLIGVHRIADNVLGDDGRWDWLLEFDHPEIEFDYIARLHVDGLTWTSDFIVNCRKDYNIK